MSVKAVWRSAALLLLVLLTGCGGSSTVTSSGNAKEAAQANADLGLRYMLQGNNELAMEKLKRALDQDSGNANANHYMAELYKRLERYDDAEKYFRQAIRLSDDDPNLYNNFGAFLCGRNRYDDAEEMFLKALETPAYSGRSDTLENVGLCMLDKPDVKKGEEYLRKALAAEPGRPKALLGMAKISFAQKGYLSTRAYLQRYLDVARHTPETLWLGIRTERILGDRDAVASYGMQLKNAFPKSEEARLYLRSIKP